MERRSTSGVFSSSRHKKREGGKKENEKEKEKEKEREKK